MLQQRRRDKGISQQAIIVIYRLILLNIICFFFILALYAMHSTHENYLLDVMLYGLCWASLSIAGVSISGKLHIPLEVDPLGSWKMLPDWEFGARIFDLMQNDRRWTGTFQKQRHRKLLKSSDNFQWQPVIFTFAENIHFVSACRTPF